MTIKVMCFTAHYLPSFKAGGPVKTIFNMIEQLKTINFSVVTSDRDLGDNQPFDDVMLNQWNTLEKCDVMYLSSDNQSIFKISNLVKGSTFDVIYLNSFFDYNFSIKYLISRKFGFVQDCPIVLAPRGEFSKGALSIKYFKKKLFLKIASFFGLYNGIVWQASSSYEKQDIIDCFPRSCDSIFIAKDLPSKLDFSLPDINYNSSTALRVVFISRISPKKNLDFALKILTLVKADVVFDIYGPIENIDYWNSCLKIIENMPDHIIVNYCGSLEPDNVGCVFSRYDLFLFPTHGENYGHVIAESLTVGTAVLLSDQTPWRNLKSDSLGWDLSLNDISVFVEKIELFANYTIEERTLFRFEIIKNASSRVNCSDDILANNEIFKFTIERFYR